MVIEDLFTFIAGTAVGAIVILFVVLNAFKNMSRDERVSKAALVKVNGQLKVNPITLHDYYEVFFAYLAFKIFPNKALKVRNAALARTLMLLFWVLCIFCAYVGLRFLIIVSPNA